MKIDEIKALELKGIVRFLQKEFTEDELIHALRLVRIFKQCESQEEWLNINFDAWAKLEQLEEYLAFMNNESALKEDTIRYIERGGT